MKAKRRTASDTLHRQVRIRFGRQSALVDEGMAMLIQAIWAIGIPTEFSCQEIEPGWAYIYFASVQDASDFVDALCNSPIMKRDLGGLYSRAVHFGCHNARDCWRFSIGPNERKNFVHHNFWMTITFPSSDIPLIIEHLMASINRELKSLEAAKKATANKKKRQSGRLAQ